ncbi:hypothetical protein GCK32_009662 [Trichostrongylus colubriformis]|uniref:Uncharacterized protein n=1 Tax=Trichostrongylus colubriformis TaxID=6319 RepID=A0AAN8II25_TRICO
MVRLGILFCIASTTAFPLIPSAFEDDRSKNLLLPFGIIGDVDALSKQGNIWYSPMTIGTLSLDEGEWLTVKDGFLYCGGQGREEATATGEFISDYSLYVKRISKNGVVESGSWAKQFIALRAAIQIRFPGYLIHEAVQCAVMIGHEVHDRGFSAFQFVPGTKDTVIAAVKSQELLRQPFASFIMVFTIDGRIILDETRVPGYIKYEGIEFLSDEHFKSFVG